MKFLFPFIFLLSAAFGAQGQSDFRLEYYLDKDEGFGKNTIVPVKVAEDAPLEFTASTKGLAPGTHSLGFRIQDKDGRWSHTSRKLIDIHKEQEKVIIALEYFLGNDPGFAKGVPVTIEAPFANGEYTFRIPRSELLEGQQTLFVRSISKQEEFSHTQWKSSNIMFLNCAEPAITQNGISFSATTADTYQWYKDGTVINGAISQTYQPIENGQYTVRTTTREGCEEMSPPIQFVITGLEPSELNSLKAYPNPFYDFISIGVDTPLPVSVNVYAITGRLQYSVSQTSGPTCEIPTDGWPTGTYVVYVSQGETTLGYKMLIKL